MRKVFFILSITIVCCPLSAQSTETLETIYANEYKNVALFFPEPIRQGITGSDHFVFTYNREKQQYFGLLQAKPGKESNLLVISENGTVFSYLVRYREALSQLNYFIPKSQSIGNERPLPVLDVDTGKLEEELLSSSEHYKDLCARLIKSRQRIGKIKKRNQGIVLNVENIVFLEEELYFVIEVKNNSTLDYDLNFLKLFVETRQKGKRKSVQRLYQKPLFAYSLPAKVREGEKTKLVYVLPKFSLSDERRAVLELNEQNGERNIKLKIAHSHINNPN